MFVHRTWYWAAWSTEVQKKPLHRKYLNKDVVLFRDTKGALQALSAVCPHRGANLAEGQIEGDCIRCPFHGLKFDATGKCVDVPSQPPSERIPKTAKVDVYPIREQDGIIWIWMDPAVEPDHVPPHCDMFDRSYSTHYHQHWTRKQKGDFAITVETGIEDSHVPYLHKSSLKVPVSRIPKYSIEKFPNGRGFAARYDHTGPWWIDTDLPKEKGLMKYVERAGETRRADYYMGGHVRQHFGGDSMAGLFITPCTNDTNWFSIAFSWRNQTLMDRFINFLNWLEYPVPWTKVFDEDEWATSEMILTDRPFGLERPVFVQSDIICSEFRKIYRHYLKEEGREWGQPDSDEARRAG